MNRLPVTSYITTAWRIISIAMMTLLCLCQTPAQASRVKDLAKLEGVRNNQLIGYGIVTGLNGTGDDMKKSLFTLQAVYNMMIRNGITVNPDEIKNIKMKNIAAVMVTANLPPFAKPGSTIDIQVSSIGDASSLAGGTLLMTPLRGADEQVYAVAQGPLTIGALGDKGLLTYQLSNADFTTATRIADAIYTVYGQKTAFPGDSGSVTVTIPKPFQNNTVEFIASIENLDVDADSTARVVVNERTGTIVMGKDVRLSTVAVSHGNLNLIIKEDQNVVQPNPLTEGQTVVTPQTKVTVTEDEGQLMVLEMKKGVSIGQIASALNAIGATPRDLIAIFEAIKAAGSMHGELIIL